MTENQKLGESYLLRIREKEKKYKATLMEIEALEYAASGQGAIRYDKDKVQTSSDPNDRMIEFIQDAIAKRAELEKISIELDELKVSSYQFIKRMANADERIILEWYYINAKPMEEAMRKLCVSERKAYYIRDDALEHFGELLSL